MKENEINMDVVLDKYFQAAFLLGKGNGGTELLISEIRSGCSRIADALHRIANAIENHD